MSWISWKINNLPTLSYSIYYTVKSRPYSPLVWFHFTLNFGPLPKAWESESSEQYQPISRTALFWAEISQVVSGISWSLFSSLGVTAPSAAMTIRNTVLTQWLLTTSVFPLSVLGISRASHSSSLCDSHLKLLLLSSLLSSLSCWPPQSGYLAITCLSLWIWKSLSILALSFFTTHDGISHFDSGTSSPYWTQMFLYTLPGQK